MEKPPNNNHLVQEGMMEGLRVARTEGLKVGDLVYHPSEDRVYMLKSVDGDTAIVHIPAGSIGNETEIVKEFPYSELINQKAALRGAIEAKIKRDVFPDENIESIN